MNTYVWSLLIYLGPKIEVNQECNLCLLEIKFAPRGEDPLLTFAVF
jgi:hypothetical protein